MHFKNAKTAAYFRELADKSRYTKDGRRKRGRAEKVFVGAGVTICYKIFQEHDRP